MPLVSLIVSVFAFVLLVLAGCAPVAEPWPWRWPWRLLCFGLACHVAASFFPH